MLTAHRVLTNIPISCSKFLDPNTHQERDGSHYMNDINLELDILSYSKIFLAQNQKFPQMSASFTQSCFPNFGCTHQSFFPLSSLRVYLIEPLRASLVAQTVKNLPAKQETWVHPMGQEDPLEEEIATDSSILAWRIPMDRGAWRITTHGVPKSQTWLKQLSTQDSYHQSQRPVHHSFHSSRTSRQ